MSQIITLSKSIKTVESKSGQVIEIPSYCRKRISFFRYNKDTETLEIVCRRCQKSFPVLQLSEEGGKDLHWKDIHKESEYHLMSETSGYEPECMACKNKEEKPKEDKPINKEEKVSYTVFLTPENKKYLQLYKIVYEEEITEVINKAIDDLRAKKPIEVIVKD